MQFILLFLSVFYIGVNAQFSKAGQQIIVDAHNALRSKIARGVYVANGTVKPPASNMFVIQWDDEIAASAQKYTDKCPTGHSYTPGLGENMWAKWKSGAIGDLDQYAQGPCNAWEGEFNRYGWKSNLLNAALFNTGIGHASQMAWAKTRSIGCGVKDCGKQTDGSNKVLVICQYKKQGNFLGQEIYKEGKTCSDCGPMSTCDGQTGLCIGYFFGSAAGTFYDRASMDE